MKIEYGLKYKLSFSLKELEKAKGDPITIGLFKIILEDSTSEEALRKAVSEFEAKIKTSKAPPLEAINLLGICYLNGLGIANTSNEQTERNQKQAVELFTSISDSYPEARYHLAWYYLHGTGVVPNVQQAKALCDKDPKSPHTENFLAKIYERGGGDIAKNNEQAQRHYLKAIEAGHAMAMQNYAEFLDMTSKSEQDKRIALSIQESAAKLGYAPAQERMSVHYFHGVQMNGKTTILEKDLKKSFEYGKAMADQGLSDAQNALGNYYLYGTYVQKDYEQAIKYFRLAAEQGHGTALSNLGLCYERGYGVEKDLTKAFDLYQQSANKDDNVGICNLAGCYAEGLGVNRDVPKAVDLWKKQAHERDYLRAQLRLGNVYRYGWYGVQKDEKTAVEYYKLAADREDNLGNNEDQSEAQYELGLCYEYGVGVIKDVKQAKTYYERAARLGYSKAQLALGQCYQFGIGSPIDKKLAAENYSKAAEQGNAEAQYRLGLCYENGFGLRRNLSKALEQYEKSANQNHPRGLFLLGSFYQDHRRNFVKAFERYQHAFKEGHCFWSAQSLGQLYKLGLGVPMDKLRSLEYYQWAASGQLPSKGATVSPQNLAQAQYHLAGYYQSGEGVMANTFLARLLFEAAGAKGHQAAQGHFELMPKTFKNGSPIPELKNLSDFFKAQFSESNSSLSKIDLNYYLGFCYLMGLGIEQDVTLAIKHLVTALDGGESNALWNLLFLYRQRPTLLTSEQLDLLHGKLGLEKSTDVSKPSPSHIEADLDVLMPAASSSSSSSSSQVLQAPAIDQKGQAERTVQKRLCQANAYEYGYYDSPRASNPLLVQDLFRAQKAYNEILQDKKYEAERSLCSAEQINALKIKHQAFTPLAIIHKTIWDALGEWTFGSSKTVAPSSKAVVRSSRSKAELINQSQAPHQSNSNGTSQSLGSRLSSIIAEYAFDSITNLPENGKRKGESETENNTHKKRKAVKN